MNLLQSWFNGLSSVLGRFLWKALLIGLALTVAGQVALNKEMGRMLLNPVELLEGVPWPPAGERGGQQLNPSP